MAWALRSVIPWLAAMSRSRAPGSCAMYSSTRAWLVRKAPGRHAPKHPQNSGNALPVFGCDSSHSLWKKIASFKLPI